MTESLTPLLHKFRLELREDTMAAQLGGYYACRNGQKHIVLNRDLSEEKKAEVGLEIIDRHCRDQTPSAFLPYFLFDEGFPEKK
ncbi:hypothetical protein N6H14_23220 [Paenibacillus sp. CC-CFT747]|nr:hypothetical protein N6H14_23220 [Paenibacillus sp. CC-CFT747]